MTDNSNNAAIVQKNDDLKNIFNSSAQEKLCLKLAVDYIQTNKKPFEKLDWAGSPMDERIPVNNLIVQIAHDRYNRCVNFNKIKDQER